MKRHILHRIALGAATLAVLAFASCTREGLPDASPADGTRQTFTVSVPAATAVATRALDENAINEITVLLFDDKDKYLDSIAVPAGQMTGTTPKQFTVVLPTESRVALLLANAAEHVDPLTTAMTIDDVEESLIYTINGKYSEDRMVMSSDRIDLTDYKEGDEIKLARNVAKIDLILDAGNFTLKEVQLVNYNTTAHVVPTQTWWKPTLPGSTTWPVTNTDLVTGLPGIRYSDEEITDNRQIIGKIFTPERAADNSRTPDNDDPDANIFLLISGDVDGAADPRWFKLAFRLNDEYIDILRNYAYTVTITGVGNTGWSSPQDAYNHPAEGIEMEITANPDMDDITSNGQYQLAINRSQLQSFIPEGESQNIDVYTDYPGGWTVERVSDTWITAPAVGDIGSADAITPLTAILTANAGSARTGTITLRAGNLVKTIHITQEAASVPPPPEP